MGFLGTIARPLRRVLASFAEEIDCPVLLPCAGNFTIGAALRSGGFTGPMSGCDITLYTTALGMFLAGKTFPISIRKDIPPQLVGFLDLSSPIKTAASVALVHDLLQVWQAKNQWHLRVLSQYREAWPKLMSSTEEKLARYRDHLTKGPFDYYAKDALELLRESDRHSAVILAPPTFGTSDYLKQERMLDASVEWEKPSFEEIDFKNEDVYREFMEFDNWMMIMERPNPDVEKLLGDPIAVVHKGRNSITYAYAGHTRKRVVTRSFLQSESPGPIFPGDRRLTGKEEPGITILNNRQTIRLNELFMSVRVDYILSGIMLSVGLCLDKKIIGKLDFKFSKVNWAIEETGFQVYQQSDLAVPSVEKRLAKLVLLFAQSKEVKKLLDDAFKEDCRVVTITAFSRNPVSMKYRGIYKFHKRLEGEGVEKFRLNYYAPLGLWTMREAYDLWLKKYRK